MAKLKVFIPRRAAFGWTVLAVVLQISSFDMVDIGADFLRENFLARPLRSELRFLFFASPRLPDGTDVGLP